MRWRRCRRSAGSRRFRLPDGLVPQRALVLVRTRRRRGEGARRRIPKHSFLLLRILHTPKKISNLSKKISNSPHSQITLHILRHAVRGSVLLRCLARVAGALARRARDFTWLWQRMRYEGRRVGRTRGRGRGGGNSACAWKGVGTTSRSIDSAWAGWQRMLHMSQRIMKRTALRYQ